jgi:hypothetical protein
LDIHKYNNADFMNLARRLSLCGEPIVLDTSLSNLVIMPTKAIHHSSTSRFRMPVVSVLLLASVTGAYGFAFLPSRHYASYPSAKTVAAGAATLKNAQQQQQQQQQTASFVRRYGPSSVALMAESTGTGGGTAKNASEVSHEELRSYRDAMSISRTEGKVNGASSDQVRVYSEWRQGRLSQA